MFRGQKARVENPEEGSVDVFTKNNTALPSIDQVTS